MKKGDKVKCVDRGGCDYLTEGKVYKVTAGYGSRDHYGRTIADLDGFMIVDDDGDSICCELNYCAHAIWELVE